MPARLMLLSIVTALCVLFGAGAASAAAPPPGTSPALVRDHDRAIGIASRDRRVVDRLALRPGLEVRAGLVDFAQSPVLFERQWGQAWLLQWYDEGGDKEAQLSVVVSLERGVLNVGGLGMVIMPGEDGAEVEWLGPAWSWILLCAAFLVCVAGAFRRGTGALMLLPLVIAGGAHILTLANVVPSDHIRLGNVALFAAPVAALAFGAVIWTRRSLKPAVAFVPRGRRALWGGIWALGIALQAVGVTRVRTPIDVAWASDAGARLMRSGTVVYGNLADAPEVGVHGDTYGPMAYLAYLPGLPLGNSPTMTVLLPNLAFSIAVGALLVLIGSRRGSLDLGLWCAAAWTTCPVVATGVWTGNNDIVVALVLVLVLLTVAHPPLRGALLALAAATKFLPALLLLPLIRLRGEPPRAAVTTALAFAATSVLVFGLAVRGVDGLDALWERTIAYQFGRTDVKSVWGLAGVGDLRFVPLVAAVALAVVHAIRWRHLQPHVAAFAMASVLALLICALALYWGSYVTWIVPIVLVAMVWHGTAPRPATRHR